MTDAGTDGVNPVDAVLLRWQAANPKESWFPAPINGAEWKHPVTKKAEKMTPEQLAEFGDMAGKRASAILKITPLNADAPTKADIDRIKGIVSKAREDAKKILSYKFARG